ncbi:MAG: hypothetical protein V4501_09435, partial [Pseudomonadota bacterium]
MRISITDLKSQIITLKKKFKPETDETMVLPEVFDLAFISQELLFLKEMSDKELSYEEKFILEEYKLELLVSFRNLFNQAISTVDVSPAAHVTLEPNTPHHYSYFTYLTSGLGVNIVHGYVSSHAILVLIPTITAPVLVGIGVAMTVLNALAYYLYEGYVLKKNLSIPILTQNAEEYFAVFEEQLQILPTVNEKLHHYAVYNNLTTMQYKKFGTVAAQFNELILANRPLFKNYEESGTSYTIRQGIIAFGAVMAAASAFFSAKSFLTLVSAPLLATPAGIAFMGICVALAVTFYFGQRVHKVYKMMNPEAYKFKTIEEQFQIFKPRLQNDYNKIIKSKILKDINETPDILAYSSAVVAPIEKP